MPELPDILVYIEALERRVLGQTVTGFRIASPAMMRTYDPPYESVVGERVDSIQRVGKRIVFGFNDHEGGRPPSDPPPEAATSPPL